MPGRELGSRPTERRRRKPFLPPTLNGSKAPSPWAIRNRATGSRGRPVQLSLKTGYGFAGGVIADGEDSAAGDAIAPPSSVVFL